MSVDPDWLPSLICMTAHNDKWADYVEAIYSVFQRDFIASQPRFCGMWVRCRRDPIYDGKVAGFWHCISDGDTEEDRIPDFRRCERIGWIRAAIENSASPGVDVWENERYGEKRSLIWVNEGYLIVLAHRVRKRDGFKYFQLVTAYCTPQEHSKKKLRMERDEWKKGNKNV